MNTSSSTNAPRTRRVVVAAAGALALVVGVATISQIDTVAAFADSAWAGGTFNLGESVDIESATAFEGEYSDHAEPQGAIHFGPSLSLVPGGTTYAGVYIRTTGISTGASVKMSPVVNIPSTPNSLWTQYVLYNVRSTAATGSEVCNASLFTDPSGMAPTPLGTTNPADVDIAFELESKSDSVEFVCFQFNLSTSVLNESSLNGDTVDPVWRFTAEEVSAP